MAAELRQFPSGTLVPSDLLDALTTAVLIVDAVGAVHFLNNAAQSLLAVGRAQAKGRLLA
jgi:nitrogen-specific signal transduction histidine kinase